MCFGGRDVKLDEIVVVARGGTQIEIDPQALNNLAGDGEIKKGGVSVSSCFDDLPEEGEARVATLLVGLVTILQGRSDVRKGAASFLVEMINSGGFMEMAGPQVTESEAAYICTALNAPLAQAVLNAVAIKALLPITECIAALSCEKVQAPVEPFAADNFEVCR
jgi:histidine ammonia-lyase